MFIGRILFFAFLAIPIAEIYVLIEVGSVIGAFPTIMLIVFTAILGSILIRAQGLTTLARVREAMQRGEIPAVEMMEGMCLLLAGAFLLTPGFVTDTMGFILLIPALRRAVILTLLERGILRPATGPQANPTRNRTSPPGRAEFEPNTSFDAHSKSQPGQIIDGEFERKDD